MKIESVALSLPSWKLDNEEVVDLIKFHSKATFSGNLEKALRKVSVILKKTGAETRFWLNKQINEKPIDHIIKCSEEALKEANLSKDDIDLLVFVGIGKGFLEPAQSYFVAKALGINKAKCFDVTDACMSWMTAVQIIDSFFKTGSYKKAMIINSEFTVQGGVLFKNYALKNEEQLEHTFPTFTVGEGATCTIFSPEDLDNFKFKFSSRNDLADLCVIPLPNYENYSRNTAKLALNGSMHFTSFGVDLHSFGEQEIIKVLDQKIDDIKITFTHSSSKTEWQKYSEIAGLGDKIYHIYQKTGNLVSASIPAAMKMAIEDNKLSRGDKILAWVGSAGMSFGSLTFNF